MAPKRKAEGRIDEKPIISKKRKLNDPDTEAAQSSNQEKRGRPLSPFPPAIKSVNTKGLQLSCKKMLETSEESNTEAAVVCDCQFCSRN